MDSSLSLVIKASLATRTKEETSSCVPWPFLLRIPYGIRINILSLRVCFRGFLRFGI